MPGWFNESPSTGQVSLRVPLWYPSHCREAMRGLERDVQEEEGDLC